MYEHQHWNSLTIFSNFCFLANAATRVKRQEDEGESDGQSTDELCQDRPGDEYFRLTTDGDCRDVVR